jgi:hypothetical protein
MTVNGIEKGCVLEFIAKHQKSEAHHVKEWNKSAEKIAVTTDENTKEFFIDHKEQSRRRLVVEQGIIKEFAILLGKTTKHVDIRTQPTGKFMLGELLEVRSVEVI